MRGGGARTLVKEPTGRETRWNRRAASWAGSASKETWVPDRELGPGVTQTGTCVACGTSGVDLVWDSRLPGLMRCLRCGLRSDQDPITADERADAYRTGFYSTNPHRGARLIGLFRQLNGAIRLRALSGLHPGRLLDIGCGKGHFLAAARAAGWEVVGVDTSPAAAEYAHRHYGISVHVGDAQEIKLDRPFDAVTMWHVLEHLADPSATLDLARELLGPGGRLVVSVPNLASAQARAFGNHWFHLDRRHHLHHFTPEALRALLTRRGFTVERIGSFYPEMEGVGFVQSLLNRVGFEDDLLYRFLKRDGTVHSTPQIAGSIALGAISLPAALALILMAPLVGLGASIQVVATVRGEVAAVGAPRH